MKPHGYRSKIHQSGYAWNNRPRWDYIGLYRIKAMPRKFSIKDNVKETEPERLRWKLEDQAWAVGEGFFVQRELVQERPVIVGIHLNRSSQLCEWPKGVFTYDDNDGSAAYREIVRRCFREPQSHYHYLLKFMQQQDEYGFTGAWDIAVQNYQRNLLWYKNFIAKIDGGIEVWRVKRAQQVKAYLKDLAKVRPGVPAPDFDEVAYMNADMTTKAHKRKARFEALEKLEKPDPFLEPPKRNRNTFKPSVKERIIAGGAMLPTAPPEGWDTED